MGKKEESQKKDKEWVCSVCGYKYIGPEPPRKCSKCGVDAQYFDAVEYKK